ncbi:hypothetical protein NL676_007669 [Syzygium grande]|nr:hypothetical protein NL676_007669 [Syzygium grande]
MRPSPFDSATISRHFCSPSRPQPPHAREFVASSSIQNEVVMATPTRPRFVGGPGQDQALLLPGLESLLDLLFKWSYFALCNFAFHGITCYARSVGCSGGDLGVSPSSSPAHTLPGLERHWKVQALAQERVRLQTLCPLLKQALANVSVSLSSKVVLLDKALAVLAIEDKKRQYAAAEKYLEDVLHSALATSE